MSSSEMEPAGHPDNRPAKRPTTALATPADDSAGFEIRDLGVAYRTGTGQTPVVVGATLHVRPGQITGLAGESGSGKTTVALTAIGYLPAGAIRLSGEAILAGRSILGLSRTDLRREWAANISYVAQDAVASLNPARRIGGQLEEILTVNLGLSRDAARRRAVELLEAVSLANPGQALRRYPHQFSGGELQRVAIAMAIAPDPKLIVFDEPTTGLDVTTHAEVIAMLNRLIRERRLAAIYISHDLALLAAISDELVILYAGEVVESGPTNELLRAPRHPYTRALLDSLPSVRRNLRPRGIPGLPPGRVVPDACGFASRCRHARPECTSEHPVLRPIGPDRLVRCVRSEQLGVLPSEAARLIERPRERAGKPALQIDDLICVYGRGTDRVVAVEGVSLEIREREVVGLVGESGSGKSTIGRAIVGLVRPQSGTIRWCEQPLPPGAQRSRLQHREIQIIFQNPDSSLNPRQTIGQLVGRAVALFRPDVPRASWSALVADALREVQIDPDMVTRYPHQLSGGQKQRVAMARAFVARPRLVICDEIISGQDVSVQAAILELMRTMQREHETALLFISHDLAAVRSIAQYVYVLQGGRLQEEGPTERLFEAPEAAYTRRLLASVLEPQDPNGAG